MGKMKLNGKISGIFGSGRAKSGLVLLTALALSSTPSQAGIVTFDGDGASSITLGTPANWDTNALPITTDQATFTDAGFGGPLPASLTNSVGQTWGNLVWNSNSSTTFSGTRVTLSGQGGNANGDLITLGSNVTSGTVNLAFTSGATSFISATTGNFNVVNAGATLNISTQFEFNNAVTNQVITKTGAGTINITNGNNGNAGAGAGSKFILDGGTLNLVASNGNAFGGSGSTVFEIRNGTALDTLGASFDITLSKNYAQTWAGDFTFKGSTKALNLGTGAVTMTGSRQITVNALTLGVGGVIGDGGNGYGITKTGAGTLSLSGNNTFTGGVTVNQGTLSLSGTNSYTGNTVVNGGALTLGFNGTLAPVSNIVNTASTLQAAGGTVTLTGKASTLNSQTFNGLTLNAGSTQFTATAGATGGSMTANLGTVTRNTGGTINFTLPTTGAITVSNSNNANGLLGAGMTVGTNDWATVSGGNVVAFTGYTTQSAVGSWAANQNITNTAAFSGTLGSNLTINSLKINTTAGNAATANLGGNTLTVLDGILITNTVNRVQTISNGSIQGSAGGDLTIINNYNGTNGAMTISANVIDNTSATALTKAGANNLILSGNNTYTGATYVNAGTLSAGSANPAFGNNSAVVLSTGATLALANFSQTIGSLGGNTVSSVGAVTLGSGTLTTGGNNSSTTFRGVISGTGGFTKAGSGIQTLTGINTYTGATTVSSGTLLVNGSLAAGSAVSVQANGSLGGSGTVNGSITVAGTLTPGNSPGTLSTGAQTWLDGADYNFQLADANGIAGTGYDTIAITGGLDLSNLTAGGFDINLWTLSSTGPDVNGNALNFDSAGNYSWILASTTAGITGFDAANFDINTAANNGTSGFSNSFGGVFSVSTVGNDLILNYTAVPEPSTYALFGLGLGTLWVLRRKKKNA